MNKYLILGVAALALTSCKVEQEEALVLPDVDMDVDVDAGNLPEFDVDWADINVGTRTRTIEVPKVVVVMEEEEIEVPYLDVDMPGEFGEKYEQTLTAQAEVMDYEYSIDIEEVRADKNNLYVIAELERGDQEMKGQKMRIQDQIDINAPDLNVRYIIMGDKPARKFNNGSMYVKDMNSMPDRVKNAKVIWED